MKIDLTYKEANLLMAILWELAGERHIVLGGYEPMWRLSDLGAALGNRVILKLEDANEDDNAKSGKDRDLSGAPKGSIEDGRWGK
jgi:hypothetical protein